ncbi:MAG: lysozyme inhibitor LprI family protein [Cypionkella sp.]
MIRFTALAVLLTALPLGAQAQDVDCTTAEFQVEMTYCAEQDWKAADVRLNDAYKVAISAMKDIDANLDSGDRGAEAALRAAQRAWIIYRDQTCAAEGWSAHGGSLEPMFIYACRARVTASRADEMENMAAGD